MDIEIFQELRVKTYNSLINFFVSRKPHKKFFVQKPKNREFNSLKDVTVELNRIWVRVNRFREK